MNRRVTRLAAVAAVIVAGVGVAVTRGARPAPASDTSDAARVTGFTERGNRDLQIAVWHQALAADTGSALVLGQLAALHLQRAREGGGWDDYLVAERFARRSLGRRTFRNAPTAATLVSILLAQHRFVDAKAVAMGLVSYDSETPEYRAILAEVSMELGDDAAADSLFRSVWSNRSTLTIAARLARWLELNGHVPEARRLLVTASADARSRRDVSHETQAWFALRVGDLELRAGRLRAAEDAFRDGRAIEPDDPRLFAAMARLAQAKGAHDDVIAWGERAIGLQLDPGTLGLVGDAYAARGDTIRAQEYFSALEAAVSEQPGAFHRAWSLYLLDHGLRVDEVLRRAADELRERKDVYGYDVLAWALHQSGQRAAAQVAMRAALRLNTRDPLLERHARLIGVTPVMAMAGN